MPQVQSIARLMLSLYGEDARFVAQARVSEQIKAHDVLGERLWREVVQLLDEGAEDRFQHQRRSTPPDGAQ